MPRVKITENAGRTALLHRCPGCAGPRRTGLHAFPTGDGGWTFNGDVERPSCAPSVKHEHDGRVCHYRITDGRIAYCGDSTHALAGRTVDLPDLDGPWDDED